MNSGKRLYRSNDAIFAGVCGGIAEYFELDPTLIRILAVFLVLAGFGVPLLVYFIAMILIPKRSSEYPEYIDVQPTSAQSHTANNAAPPGRAYTTSNPEAYDAAFLADQGQSPVKPRHGIRFGVFLGILLVCVGVLALIGTSIGIPFWRFWPLAIIILGLVVLCSPGEKGWSLSRAGHGISTIAIGSALLLWTLNFVSGIAFWRTFLYLWPILLIICGLFIIGSVTKQPVFNLFGSLLFSITLLVGMWNFGQIARQDVSINLPGGRVFSITIPSPDLFPPDSAYISKNHTFIAY